MQSNTISVRSLKKKIETLENTIENFKRYDQNRKEYYKDAMIRLGQLESFMEEIEEKDKQIEIEQKKAFEYWKQIPVEAPKKEEQNQLNKSETVDSLLDKLLF